MAHHKDLTGADLHEPKGIAGQTSGKVYVSDGANSGVWTALVIPTGIFSVTTHVYTNSGTWVKPAGLFISHVRVQASGGENSSSAGTGGSASFGSHCSATGGTAGSAGAGGVGGTGSSGDINITGEGGHGDGSYALAWCPGGVSAGPGTYGNGHGILGSGAGACASGGAGGYAEKWILAGALSDPESVTINAGGLGNAIVIVEDFILI